MNSVEDWRQIYRKPGAPAPKVGDMIPGMERGRDGDWQGIVAAVESVELLKTETDGSRFYRCNLGQSIPVESHQ